MNVLNPPLVGKNILYIRKKKNLSLDELSKRSGVSKSMLSQIEQEKTNPTVITLWKISKALGTTIEKIVDEGNDFPIELIEHNKATVFYSEDKSFTFKIITPIHMADNLEIYNITSKPHGKNKSMPHFKNAEEFITVLSGKLEVTAGKYSKKISKGDTVRYKADQEHCIENNTDKEAQAFLVVWFPK